MQSRPDRTTKHNDTDSECELEFSANVICNAMGCVNTLSNVNVNMIEISSHVF